ncbi:MAG: hypothetical protein HQK83_03480, partial [Fibrobacteria bacterium]|nr:hypothetical protein [Fibrobacteria bacterium]
MRSCAIINHIPSSIDIIIISSLPEAFFREELCRPFSLIPGKLDCGCLQTDSENTDIKGTLSQYSKLHDNREVLCSRFTHILEKKAVNLVFSDIVPMAFPIARRLGVSAYGVANFNWADIYFPYLKHCPWFKPVYEQILKDYSLADGYLSMEPGMAGTGFIKRSKVGLVARQGQNKRSLIAKTFRIDPDKKWCLVYLGCYGMGAIDWSKLSQYSHWEFFGLYDLQCSIPNYHRVAVDKTLGYADLTASCEIVLGKLGYGLVSESLVFQKPVLFF